jgi:hypothetical protein
MKEPLTYSKIISVVGYDPTDPFIKSDYIVGNLVLVTYYNKDIRQIKSNVTFSAIITSRARIKWYREAIEVMKVGGRLLYCDTDSLFIGVKMDNILLKSSM